MIDGIIIDKLLIMNLIELKMTPEKIKEYNDNVKRCIKEYPDNFSESDLIEGIDDILIPYENVLTGYDFDPVSFKYVKDDKMDFKGVYWSPQYFDFNRYYFDHQVKDDNPFYYNDKYGFKVSSYGVSDNASQIISHFKEIERSMNIDLGDCVIILDSIYKATQPSEGGWRWHKNGIYIGIKEPKHEYIYDEDDDIQFVWTYHLYAMQ